MTVMATRAAMYPGRRVGVIRAIWYSVFGEPDPTAALKRVGKRGGLLLTLGHVMSILLFVAFSLGALNTLAAVPWARVLAAVQLHRLPSMLDASELAVTGLLVPSMDLALILAAQYVRDARRRGSPWRELVGHLLVIVVVSLIEGGTYVVMVVENSGPMSLGIWLLLVGRALVIPVTAVFLTLAHHRPADRRDFFNFILQEVAVMIYARLHQIFQEGQATLPHLWGMMGHLAPTTSAADTARDTAVVGDLMQMVPDAERQEYERLMAQAHAMMDGAQDEASRALHSGLMHYLATGKLPQALLDRYPDLADMPAPRGGKAPAKGKVSPRDTLRDWLASQGVEVQDSPRISGDTPSDAPRQLRGMYIPSAAVAPLTGGRIVGDACRDVLTRLPGTVKIGRSYYAPLRQVLADLSERHLLTDDAQSRWLSLNETDGNVTPIPGGIIAAGVAA